MIYTKKYIFGHKLMLLFIAVSFVANAQPKSEQKKPNIVFILTDQWRASSLGYAGDGVVQTPYLDKFAKEAINLSNTVSVTPVCTPHRAPLFTGKYPTSTGMFLNDIYLPSEELCMAEIYKQAGYQTAYIGKWHLDGHGRELNVAQKSELINQTSMATDEDGKPYIASYWRPNGTLVPQYQLAYFNRTKWITQQIASRQTAFSLSGCGTKKSLFLGKKFW